MLLGDRGELLGSYLVLKHIQLVQRQGCNLQSHLTSAALPALPLGDGASACIVGWSAGGTRLRNTHASVSQISTVAFTRDVGRTDSRLPEICELNVKYFIKNDVFTDLGLLVSAMSSPNRSKQD